jgi:hypothetical protein
MNHFLASSFSRDAKNVQTGAHSPSNISAPLQIKKIVSMPKFVLGHVLNVDIHLGQKELI